MPTPLLSPDANREWQIASFVVQIRPDHLPGLKLTLHNFTGVDIRILENCDDSRLALLAETRHHKRMRELLEALQQQPGVLSATLVYHEVVPEITTVTEKE